MIYRSYHQRSLTTRSYNSSFLPSIFNLSTPFGCCGGGNPSILRLSALPSATPTSSRLVRLLMLSPVDQLFDLYTSTTTLLLDTMLPRRSVKTRLRPLAVWFDGECHQSRRRTRCAERRFRRSKDPGDRLAWITQLRALHRLYHQKEAACWEQLVSRKSSL